MHHFLPWVESCSLVMHHTWLSIMSCLCVVCLPCCLFLLGCSCFVAIVRIRSTTLGLSTSLHLLHGLVLLPYGISGKMTVTLDLTTIIAMLVVSLLSLYVVLPTTCLSSVPLCHETTSNLWHHPSKQLYGYVNCKWRWRLLHVGSWFWNITISLK